MADNSKEKVDVYGDTHLTQMVMMSFFKHFLRLEAASGIVLMLVAALAMIIANSPLAPDYQAIIAPLTLPINDGLMAIFFLLIGLEIKREIVQGELSSWRKAALPVVGALGGVILPALIYSYYNWNSETLRGWATPCATDIAFSLGVLALFGSRVTPSLKIFLMALAVIDDLAAVIIIALFYSDGLYLPALLAAAACLVLLVWCNRGGLKSVVPYYIIGFLLWLAILHSGIHPTIADVLLGLMMPMKFVERAIHRLHGWVAFLIMPLFAFANAGVPLSGISFSQLAQPLPLGIILGLFVGKQLGIFLAAWLAVRAKLAAWPQDTTLLEFYAVCIIAGIGFTMSLFIGTLAFPGGDVQLHMRLGVLAGSLASAIGGSVLLWLAGRRKLSKI